MMHAGTVPPPSPKPAPPTAALQAGLGAAQQPPTTREGAGGGGGAADAAEASKAGQQQQAATAGGAKGDQYGLLGLLSVIRMTGKEGGRSGRKDRPPRRGDGASVWGLCWVGGWLADARSGGALLAGGVCVCCLGVGADPDLNTLALGSDLTTLGLNLNASEALYTTFASPWVEGPTTRDPKFFLPQCYNLQKQCKQPASRQRHRRQTGGNTHAPTGRSGLPACCCSVLQR